MPRKAASRTLETDMTRGSAAGHILRFAIPLLLGNVFQQLYNTVDTWVVGNYVSNEAFSAVGTVSPIINMLIGLFMGLASGAGVVISQYYGAGNGEKVRDAVHTSIALTAVLTLVFTAVGIAIVPPMLRLMKTPDEVFPESQRYLTIYFGGMAGMLFYNMGAGILRAVGDSRRPFYFLVVSAVTNVVLDLLFVIVFHMDVAGVAWATVISQCAAALLTMLTLTHSDSSVRLYPRRIRFQRDMLAKIIRVGIPAALQMAVTAFSNVFVQSYINQFGADVMSGWTAYTKIDMVIFLPMQSLALAATTFVGQNLGIGRVTRAREGVRASLWMAFASTAVLISAVLCFAPSLIAFFNARPEVVACGTRFLHWLTPFYVICCVNQVYSGALRGSGNTRAPTVIMLASFVFFRQVYLYVMSHFIANEIIPLALGYPAGWLVCSVITFTYYHRADLSRTRLVSDDEARPA